MNTSINTSLLNVNTSIATQVETTAAQNTASTSASTPILSGDSVTITASSDFEKLLEQLQSKYERQKLALTLQSLSTALNVLLGTAEGLNATQTAALNIIQMQTESLQKIIDNLNACEEDRKKLVAKQKEVYKACDELKLQQTDTQKKLNDTRELLKTTQNSLDAAKETLKTTKTALDNAKKALDKATPGSKEAKDLQQQVTALSGQVAAQQAEVTRLDGEVASQKNSIKKLENDLTSLGDQISAKTGEAKELQDDIDKRTNQIADLKTQEAEVQKAIDKAVATLDATGRSVLYTATRLTAAQAAGIGNGMEKEEKEDDEKLVQLDLCQILSQSLAKACEDLRDEILRKRMENV